MPKENSLGKKKQKTKNKKKNRTRYERLSCVAKKESERIRVEHGHSVTLVLTEVFPYDTKFTCNMILLIYFYLAVHIVR